MSFSEDHAPSRGTSPTPVLPATPISAVPPAVPSAVPTPLRVFLADDHAVVLAGLMNLFAASNDMKAIGYADNGETALKKIEQLQPPHGLGVDIVVMDVQMSPGDGIQATRDITSRWPQTKVVALSMHEEKMYLQAGLEAGASGYVLKRSSATTLLAAIRAVHRGEMYLDTAFSPVLITSLVRNPRRLRGDVSGLSLSAREEQVLRLITQGYSNKEVAASLDLSIKTIETHKARSTRKLEIDGRVEIMRYGLARGWLSNMV